jgi:hypothetical protein
VVEWNPGLVDALVKDYDRALVSVDCHADGKVRLACPRRGPLSNDEFVQFRPATLLEENPSLRRTLRKSSAAPTATIQANASLTCGARARTADYAACAIAPS